MQGQMKMVPELTKVYAVVFGAIGVSLSDVKLWLQIASVAAALGYTLWKWHKESQEGK